MKAMSLFSVFSLLLVLVLVLSLILKKFNQPLILAYLLAGILLGPFGFNLINNQDSLQLLSHVGVTLLLFIIGLHLSPSTLKNQGIQAMTLGLAQVILTWLIGLVLAKFLGFTLIDALVIGAGTAFSSTIIVLKLLTDQNLIQTHFGQVSTNILLIQDILVSLLLVLFAINPAGQSSPLLSLSLPLVLASILIVGVFLSARYLLPLILNSAAQNQELLFLLTLAWGVGIATLFEKAGLSIEIGALTAGIALANSPYADEVAARLRPIRDFFLILFFVSLGSQLTFANFAQLFIPIVIFSLFVMIVKPLIIFGILIRFKYHHKTSLKTALSLAQVSEFSLILGSLVLRDHLISSSAFTLLAAVTFISMLSSTIYLTHLNSIYQYFLPWLKKLPANIKKSSQTSEVAFDIFIFGYNRVGDYFAKHFIKLGFKVAVVDITPHNNERITQKGVSFFVGDGADPEFLESLPMTDAKLIISTIPSVETNLLAVKILRKVNKSLSSIIFCQTIEQAKALYQAGTTYVVLPHYLAAEDVVSLIKRVGISKSHFLRSREKYAVFINK